MKSQTDPLPFEVFARMPYLPSARQGFGGPGGYCHQWAAAHPELFDPQDLSLASNVENVDEYHYFEWLAAITLYRTTGMRSLVEMWGTSTHTRKIDITRRLFDLDGFKREGKAMGLPGLPKGPDLLVYRPDLQDFFFVEAKGGNDSLKAANVAWFKFLQAFTGRPVYLFDFYPLKPTSKG